MGGFWQHVDAGLREQAAHLRFDLALSRQESRELQERLMVSEATVHAQAEQLKDYRELLSESLYTYTENIHAYHRMLLRRGLLIIMAGKNTIKYNVADSLH